MGGSWTASPRRRSWRPSSSPCAFAARPSRSSRASPKRCASGSSGSRRPRGDRHLGTGGDGCHTFNISTTAALVVAACRGPGRQARQPGDDFEVGERRRPGGARDPIDHTRSGRPGGPRPWVRLPLRPRIPSGHAPRRPDPPRDRVRTAFNLLGPITNPAGASRELIGVGDAAAAPRLAEVLRLLGTSAPSSSTAPASTSSRSTGPGSSTRIADRGRAAHGSTRRRSASSRRRRPRWWESPASNAALVQAVLPASRAPGGTSSCSTRVPR